MEEPIRKFSLEDPEMMKRLDELWSRIPFKPRAPSRIPMMLEKVRRIWEANPDLRLGQLVENAKSFSPHHNIDTFSAEDSEVDKGLDEFLKSLGMD